MYNGTVLNGWAKFVYRCSYYLVKGLCKVFFRLRVEGLENIPRTGPALIASNHVSHLDPPIIGVAARRVVFHMAKRELLTVGPLRWFMTTIKSIIVDRGRGTQALLEATDYLKRGQAVVIFPEGTRSRNGQLAKGHSGAVVLALRSGCPVVPAAIIGSEKAMTKGSKMIKPVPVTVRFGVPYSIAAVSDPENIPRETVERERFRLMEEIEGLLPDHMRPPREEKLKWYGEAVAGNS